MLDQAISKVKETYQHGQVNTTVISALDESQRSKSAMLPSEQSVSKVPPEIEDIIREAAATSKKEEVKQEVPVEAPKVETAEVKKAEEKKVSPVKKKESDDEYEKDDFDDEFD